MAISRRTILSALPAAALALPALAHAGKGTSPLKDNSSVEPDAELIALADLLRFQILQAEAATEESQRCFAIAEVNMRRRQNSGDFLDVYKEESIASGHDAAELHNEQCLKLAWDTTRQIQSIPAHGVAGLAAKATAVQWSVLSSGFKASLASTWDDELSEITKFVQAVLSLGRGV